MVYFNLYITYGILLYGLLQRIYGILYSDWLLYYWDISSYATSRETKIAAKSFSIEKNLVLSILPAFLSLSTTYKPRSIF